MAYRERVPEWEAAGIKVKPVFSEEGQGYVQDALAKVRGRARQICLSPSLRWSAVARGLWKRAGLCAEHAGKNGQGGKAGEGIDTREVAGCPHGRRWSRRQVAGFLACCEERGKPS